MGCHRDHRAHGQVGGHLATTHSTSRHRKPHSHQAFKPCIQLIDRRTPTFNFAQSQLWLWRSSSQRLLMRWDGLLTSPIASSGSMVFVPRRWSLWLIHTLCLSLLAVTYPSEFFFASGSSLSLRSTTDSSSSLHSTSGPFPPLLSWSSSRCRDNEENQSVGQLGILRGAEARGVEVGKLLRTCLRLLSVPPLWNSLLTMPPLRNSLLCPHLGLVE
jgi:hypothetical protein